MTERPGSRLSDPPEVGRSDPAPVDEGEVSAGVGVVSFAVRGRPAPQGSKRHVGHGRMIESSRHVGPWRDAVRAETMRVLDELGIGGTWSFRGPISLSLVFRMSRPKGHYGTGKRSQIVKQSAPKWPIGRPDVDKLTRSTLDGLTDGGLFADDSQVCELFVRKTFTADAASGVWILARKMPR